MSNLLITASALVLAAMLVGIGLLGSSVGNRRRGDIERHARNLLLILATVSAVFYGLILIEQAPPDWASRFGSMLAQPHFGMETSEIFLMLLTVGLTGCMLWEMVRLRRHASTPQQARGVLLCGLVFPGLWRGHISNPVFLAVMLIAIAVAASFAALLASHFWRKPDGGASA